MNDSDFINNPVYIVLYKDRKYAEQYIFHGDEALRKELLDIFNEQDWDCPDSLSLREMAKICIDVGRDDGDGNHIRGIVKVQDGRGEKWIN